MFRVTTSIVVVYDIDALNEEDALKASHETLVSEMKNGFLFGGVSGWLNDNAKVEIVPLLEEEHAG